MLQPCGSWDARDKSWWQPVRPARIAWLHDQGLSADEIYRVEFYLADVHPFARLFRYALNDQGERHWTEAHTPGREHDHRLCDVATKPPRDVPLSELPPAELLGVRQ